MSQQPQREMTGVLFRNEKRSSDKAPEYTGTCTIDGQELRIAAWLKDGRNGKKFMSLQFSEPRQQSGGGSSRRENDDQGDFF